MPSVPGTLQTRAVGDRKSGNRSPRRSMQAISAEYSIQQNSLNINMLFS
jgi:hypothetical protein